MSLGRRIAIFTLVMLGTVIYTYPAVADWFSSMDHRANITDYRDSVSSLGPGERSESLQRAADFNADISPGPLHDPFAENADSGDTESGYSQVLSVSHSDVIGRVRFDEVGIDLPIYRGTSQDVISKGAGHLAGTALPIGGSSTHSVLTAHSGMASARLFTPLHDAEYGQRFWVEVLGERRWYRVDNIAIVEPDDLRELRVLEGRDELTLFTCTPVGVNSHRLLVRGTRIEAPAGDAELAVGDVTAGFPWWAAGLGVAAAVMGAALFRPGMTRND